MRRWLAGHCRHPWASGSKTAAEARPSSPRLVANGTRARRPAGRLSGRSSRSAQRGRGQQRRPGGVQDEPGRERRARRRGCSIQQAARRVPRRRAGRRSGPRPPRRAASAAATSSSAGSKLGGERRGRSRPQRKSGSAAHDRDGRRAERDEQGHRQRATHRRLTPGAATTGAVGRGHGRLPAIGSSASSRVPAPARAVHAQRAAQRLDAVGQPAQARAARRVGARRAPSSATRTTSPLVRRRTAMSRARAPAYLATFARPSEQTKNAAASCAGGKRPRGHLEPDRNGGLRDQLVEGRAEASLGERARVNAAREPEQLCPRGVELARQAGAAPRRPRRRAPAGEPRDMRSRRPASRCSAPACSLSPRRRRSSSRASTSGAARRRPRACARAISACIRTLATARRAAAATDVDQLAVRERGRVVHERRHRLTLVVDERDGPPGPVRGSRTGRPASSTQSPTPATR